jgi:glutamate-5-semialdehyde dehydrogenase
MNHADTLCQGARAAARVVMNAPDAQRVAALTAIAAAIEAQTPAILQAHARDMEAGRAAGLSDAMLDRLMLDAKRLSSIANDVRSIAGQDDPVGRVLETMPGAQGIAIQKIAVPIGVILVIFESRPNVTIDCAALCLRSGNACILRGGKEALHSNRALAAAVQSGLEKSGLPIGSVQLVQDQERSFVTELLKRDKDIDLVIPRGGEGLIRFVVDHSRIPVVKHDKGVCSVYVHEKADVSMAVRIAVNAKCQRPGVCNSIEHVLVDASVAPTFLPLLAQEMGKQGVELRADTNAFSLLSGYPKLVPAKETDWDTEYLALILAVKVVSGLEEAIAFTNQHSSQHSDSIITNDQAAAERYLREVDSACVYHNASTRFTDGGQFGLGAEVGISTNRLHARGPMGIRDLCTSKYVVRGQGQVR